MITTIMFFLHRKTNLHGQINMKIKEIYYFLHKTSEKVKVDPDKSEREQDQEEELLVE